MADKLLAVRGGKPVGKHWAERLVVRTPELKMAFNRAKDRQRILQEDPEIIGAWFTLVEETKAKYGIHDEDIYNFDETGFQMGVIGSMKKVVTGSERRARPALVQPGDREWVTVIQSICAAGYAIPPFIIYKGRVHISAWYEEASIPRNWKLSVSENG
ncbi:transposase [Pyrenophora tritici-repentis]|nr:transposase [Pyrenophora tritici-repentis]